MTRLPSRDSSWAPTVSIVTPSFNQGCFLEQTIRSVLDQDYPNVEYMVIDGGSTDGSVDIIKRNEARLAHWVSEPDRGQSDAINKGFARARGEIMAWLNSDDLYASGAIAGAVRAFEQHPEAGLVYGRCDMINERGAFVQHLPTGPFSLANALRGAPSIPQPAAFWRREAWDRVGPLRVDYHYCMDLELWISIAERFPVVHVPELWAFFRLYPGTKTSGGHGVFGGEWELIRREHHRRSRLLGLALQRPRAFLTTSVLLFLAARLPPHRLVAAINRVRGYR